MMVDSWRKIAGRKVAIVAGAVASQQECAVAASLKAHPGRAEDCVTVAAAIPRRDVKMLGMESARRGECRSSG